MHRPQILFHITKQRFDQLFAPEAQLRLALIADWEGPYDTEPDPAGPPQALANKEVIFASHRTRLDAETIRRSPNLRWIHEGTGHPPDIGYAEAFRRRVLVTHTGNVFAIPVAEMALGLFLSSYRRIADHDRALHASAGTEGEPVWANREAYGKTAGIIGLGHIGGRLAFLLKALGMRVVAYDPFLSDRQSAADMGVTLVGLEDLLRGSDGIFVAASPAPVNRHLLDGAMLDMIRPDAVLVSISRAMLIDHDALLARLTAGRFRAAFDVYPVEPLPAGDPLRKLDNVVMTPHRAGGTNEARQRMGWDFIHDLEHYAEGRPPERNFIVTERIAVERGYMAASGNGT